MNIPKHILAQLLMLTDVYATLARVVLDALDQQGNDPQKVDWKDVFGNLIVQLGLKHEFLETCRRGLALDWALRSFEQAPGISFDTHLRDAFWRLRQLEVIEVVMGQAMELADKAEPYIKEFAQAVSDPEFEPENPGQIFDLIGKLLWQLQGICR